MRNFSHAEHDPYVTATNVFQSGTSVLLRRDLSQGAMLSKACILPVHSSIYHPVSSAFSFDPSRPVRSRFRVLVETTQWRPTRSTKTPANHFPAVRDINLCGPDPGKSF